MNREGVGVPSFPTVEAAIEALGKKERFEPSDLYPRDGTLELARLEARVANLVGVDEGKLYLFTCGMSAVVAALEVASPTGGTVIAHGNQLYSQSTKYLSEKLPQRGVKVVSFDSGSLHEIDRIIQRHCPQIIFVETVANAPGVNVLDLEGFLNLDSLTQLDPVIILDNTLPTPTTLPLADILRRHPRNLIAVESGTKFYSLNQELSGLIYSEDKELMHKLRVTRRMVGSQLSSSAVQMMGETIPVTKEAFDRRNRLILSNTYRLAQACEVAGRKSGEFSVSHPNLQTHSNYDYASRRFPDGASPLFFVVSNGRLDQFDLARRMWEREDIREYCDLGQSFGCDRTRIWPDAQFPAIRISGGTEEPEEVAKIAEGFRKALSHVV